MLMADILEIAHLRTFVAIAECGGFGRAAASLHLSQPAVSQHVRQLEKRVGQPLVNRDGRKTRFTISGEALLVEARRILAVHDDALLRLDVDQVRPMVIGSTETAADQILPEVLRTIRSAYPGRGVQFYIDRSTQVSEAVGRGEVDLAVILGFGPETLGTSVGALQLQWYSAPAWRGPQPGESIQLVAYVEPCGMRQRALHELNAAGYKVEIAVESVSLEGVMAAARAGLGVAVLPAAGIRPPAGLEVRPSLPVLGQIGVNLAARRGLETQLELTAREALTGFFDAQGFDGLRAVSA